MSHPHEGIEWFTGAMLRKFNENSHKRGWDDIDLTYGDMRLKQEYEELHLELELFEFGDLDAEDRSQTAERIINEAADVANFAMMVAWKVRHERPSMKPKVPRQLTDEEIAGRLSTIQRLLQVRLPYDLVEVERVRYVEWVDEEDGKTYHNLERDQLGIGDMAAILAYGPIDPKYGKVVLTVPFSLEMIYATPPQTLVEIMAPKVIAGMETFLERQGSVDRTTDV
jgi:hypothetical protein